MTKKIFIASLLSAFIFSSFAGSVSAVEAPQDDRLDRSRFIHSEKAEELKEAEARARGLHIKIGQEQKDAVDRVLSPQDDRLDRRRYLNAKSQYQNTVQEYRLSKDQLLEARERYLNSKDEDKRQELQERIVNYLSKTVESLVHRLNRIKVWVSGNQKISANAKADILDDLDNEIAYLNNLVANSDDKSIQELQEIANTVKNRLTNYNEIVRNVVNKAKSSQIDNAWTKVNNLFDRLVSHVNKFEEKGLDVSTAREMLASVQEKLSGEKTREAVLEAYKELRILANHLKSVASSNQ